eukprot:snap_masked-scaffold_1-processed-gene-7.9-mRNA-1 protein AED:1.00 eAED:1.00 QI:0/0/0/0/1/1/5/0/721
MDGKEIMPGEEYASRDGVFFRSLQTQQMYYNLVESGFEVKFQNGKPKLEKAVGEVVWRLIKNGKEGQTLKNKSDVRHVVPGLQIGEYEFSTETPDLKSNVTVSLTVSSIFNGQTECIVKREVELKPVNPTMKVKFAIFRHQENATVVIEFRPASKDKLKNFLYKKSCFVTASLTKFPLQSVRQEVMIARQESKALLRKNEFIVELTKGASGVGMTLGWDKAIKSVIVKKIDPNGAAKRTEKLDVGDIVRGIQGQRIEHLSFKRVIKLLRSVPRTVILVIKPKLQGYKVTLKPSSKTRQLEQIKLKALESPNPSIPEPRVNVKPPPPVPPRRSSSKLVPRRSSASVSSPTRKPPPPRRSIKPEVNISPEKLVSQARPPIPKKNFPVAPIPVSQSPKRNSASFRSTTSDVSKENIIPDVTSRSIPPGFEKYEKMKKSRLPEGAIFNAWVRDGSPAGPLSFWSQDWQAEVSKKLSGSTSSVAVKKTAVKKNKSNVQQNPVAARPANPLAELKAFDRSKLKTKPQTTQVPKKSKPTTPRNPMEELKAFDRSSLRSRNKEQSKKVSNIAPTTPKNPIEELKAFNRSNLKKSSNNTEPLDNALQDETKKNISFEDTTSHRQANPLSEIKKFDRKQLKSAPREYKTLPAQMKPMNPLQELRSFDRSRLKSANSISSSASVKEDSPKSLGDDVQLKDAFSEALDNIRQVVGDRESESGSDWDDDDDWAM